MADRQSEAYEFFKRKWTPVQAAAIVGHGMAESNLDPGIEGDSGAAFGVFQHNDRKPALLRYLAERGLKPNDFQGQLEFAQHELETSESYAASQLRSATSIEAATAAFMHFERPSGYSRANPTAGHNWAGRLANAKRVYDGSASYPAISVGTVPGEAVTASPSPAKVNWSDPVQPKSPVNDVEMAAYRQQQADGAKPYGFGEGLWEATKDAQTMTWLLKGSTELLPDPTWNPSKETLQAAQEGIPKQYQDQLGAASSQAHLEQIRSNILDDVEREKRLDAMGWTGTGIRVGAAFTDVLGLGLTVLAPEIGLPAKASRWAAAGVRGAEGAAINAALEVPRVMEKPTAHGSDILWAAGAGLALGGAFGAIGRNPAIAEEAGELTRIGKSMQKHADAEDVAGKQLTTPTLGGGDMTQLGGTAGAARTSAREALTVGAEDWAHAAVDEAIARSWKPGWRWDLAGKGKGSDNAATRAFMGSTVTDVVGNADKAKVAGRTAEEYQKQVEFDFGMMSDKAHTEGFESYAKRLELPRGQRDEARAAFNAEVTEVFDNRVPGRDFSPEAVATAEKLRQGYKGLLELAQNPGRLDGSTRRPVKGFEEIPADLNYRPNIANHEKIDALTTRYGDDAIRQFLSTAFKAANRELPDDVAEAMSKGYLRRLREATAGMTSVDRMMHGNDLEGLQRALGDLDLDDAAREAVIRAVTPNPDAGGGIARSKRRTLYENTFEMRIQARDGSWDTIRMKDLFHDDSHLLFNSYARQMSGQIAMSMVEVKNPLHHPVNNPDAPTHLIDGITSREDFDKVVRDMRATWDARTDLPHDKRMKLADADQKRMEFVYDRVTGVPDQFDRTTLGRGLQVLRDYNFIRVMNQVGLAQIGETLGVVTQLGVKAALQGIPTFRAMTRDAMTGELNSAFARDMEQLSGYGADWFRDGFKGHVEDASGVLINRSAQSNAYNATQDVLHSAKRVTNVISGMAPIDTMARRWASAAIVMKIMNAAVKSEGSAKVQGLNVGRMRALGLSDEMAQRVFAQIRAHSYREEVGSTGRKYVQGGFREWQDQEALAAFRGAVWRWSRSVIQENHLGQGSVLLGSAMGRTIFQFRSFMLGAYTNQFLRGIHHMDFNTFATWVMTSTVGSMVYVGQQHLNTLGRADREKVLKEKLSPKSMAAAWVQRGEWSSILPTLLDSGADLTGFPHLFDTRASGTASAIVGNPSIDLANSSFKGIGGIGRAVRDGGWSQPEARTAARLLPYSNALGMVPLLNTMISTLPEHKPRKAHGDGGLW
ncbi:hypothetical protein ASF60_13975 [Methylobacterium sp. Leaf113]|uniref:phage tail tip lysozyme n=1 Tax=Methylobacterium sp. Leaf113 TaxID=1736259 RepID=UPI0006FB6350|nr:phage tail tip lysozyme [Methylobacterium sp. Leaf113]KQP93771.1 hypothetical protein ASF60_13975 [Methylobacterium sp. Leaf113]